jgi:hypothetical protein
MPLRSLLTLVVLTVLLGGCADQRSKAAVDGMERRHTDTMLIMGGGGGGSM